MNMSLTDSSVLTVYTCNDAYRLWIPQPYLNQIIPQLLTLLLLEQIPTFPVLSSSFSHHVPSGRAMAALYRSTLASGQGEAGWPENYLHTFCSHKFPQNNIEDNKDWFWLTRWNSHFYLLLNIVKKDDLFRTTNLFETPRWYPSKAHSSDQGCQITFQLISLSEMTYLGICSPAYTEWLPVLMCII